MIKKILLYVVFAIPSLFFGFFSYFYNSADARSSIAGALAFLLVTYLVLAWATGDLKSKKAQTDVQETPKKHAPPTPVETKADIFVNKLIEKTKSGQLQWRLLRNNQHIYPPFCPSYYIQWDNIDFVLNKQDVTENEFVDSKSYIVMYDEDSHVLGSIHRGDCLSKGDNLMRLYRIVQRQVSGVDDMNRIYDIMERFCNND